MKQDCVRAPIINNSRYQQCKIHKAANQTGEPISIDPKCKCCNLPYKKRHLNFWFSQKQIFYLGPGMVLFFRFILISFIVVCVPMLLFSIPAIITNVNSQNTINLNYSKSWVIKFSTFNSLTNINQIITFLLAASAILLIILIPILVKFSLKIMERIYSPENNLYYPQLLAVLIKLERPANYSEQVVSKILNQWFEIELKIATKQVAQGFNAIENIYFHFNYQLFEQVSKQIAEYQIERQRQQQFMYSFQINNNNTSKNTYKDSFRYSSKKTQKSLQAKLNKAEILKQKLRNKQLQKTNKFIVVFKSFQYALLIKQNTKTTLFKNNLNKLIFPKQNYAKVFDAPFPSQIQFKVQHLSYRQKRCKRIISWLITVLCIFVGTALQFGVIFVSEKISPFNQFQYGSIVLAAILYVISQVGCALSKIFVQNQFQPNKTQKDCSQSYHIFVCNIFLKCISLYLVFTLSNFPLYSNKGLIQVCTWLTIIWGSLIIMRRFFNLSILFYFIQSFSSQSQIKKLKIDQKEYNKLFQSPQNKINFYYAQIASYIFANFTFCSLSPINLFICSGTIFISFLVEKICFVDIYKQPNPSTDVLYISISYIIWKSPIFLILGQFYVIFIFQNIGISMGNTIKIIFSVILGLCIISLFLPQKLMKIVTQSDLTYDQIKNKIINGYQDFNPLYSMIPLPENPLKSVVRTITKSDLLIEQLNTMSKSLQVTLRQRLFNQKNPCIQQLGNRLQDSMYFQFDNKVEMPKNDKKKKQKNRIPPIFKPSKKDSQLKIDEQRKKKERQLVRLTHLATQQQAEIKQRIKNAIKGSINKLQ